MNESHAAGERVNAGRTSRRDLLVASAAAVGLGTTIGWRHHAHASEPRRAHVAITLDLEMSRNFPRWEDTHWDYEKGNLDAATKAYAVEAARRVKSAGGIIHFFAVGQVFEQENLDWLRHIVEVGHPVGNHTYDHVNVLATKPEEIQFRFRRAPWLLRGRGTADVIADNIRMCSEAIETRLGIRPAGFRTPGGFANGLEQHAGIQQMLLDLGFNWVSSRYPSHLNSEPGKAPSPQVYESIVESQSRAQPFRYPTGLIEVPMSPISDIGAFRNGRWHLEWFLSAIRASLEWTIEHGAAFDFLGHPSCLAVTDPDYKAIDLICELVRRAGDRAAIVDLDAIGKEAVGSWQ